MEKLQLVEIKCPDCLTNVLKAQLKDHVLNCKKYKSSYLKNILRSIDFMTSDNAEFIIAQFQIAQQRLREIIAQEKKQNQKKNNGLVKQNQQIKLNQNKKTQNQDNQLQNSQKTYKNQTLYFQKPQEVSQYKRVNNIQQHSVIWTKNSGQKNKKDQVSNQEKNQKSSSFMDEIQNDYKKMYYDSWNQRITCSSCLKNFESNDLKNFTYADICLHPICINCLKSFIDESTFIKNNGKCKCPQKSCKQQIPIYQFQTFFGKAQIQNLQQILLKKNMNLITCVKCKSSFDYIKGKYVDAPNMNLQGKKLEQKYIQLFSQNRFKCPNCKTQQCKQCHQTPYHLGKTCDQFKINKNLKKCRYCLSPLPLGYTSSQGIKAFDNICESLQCLKKSRSACSKINSCNHPCYGFIKQKQCLPCLNEKCALLNQKQLNGVNQNQYCNICFIEGLGSSPCVQLKCKHIFHLDCLKKRIQVRWFTPRILFNFCLCPLCKNWMQTSEQCQIYKPLMDFKILQRLIAQKARQRLKYQNLDKDQKLTDPKSPYYKDQVKYALALYAYFQCFKCKKPYYGGRKNCAQAMNQQKDQKFDPKQLVCPQCCPIQAKNCDKHGKQFINFKCKFCCNVAVWFCWGNTHFCDDCHKKQVAGTYLSKMKKQDLPKCQGPGKCPIGGNHDGNGQTRSLGCGICLNQKAGIKDF